MCGIVGLIDKSGGPDLDLVPIMRDTMIHRGPDGTGEYRGQQISMAMRRLSIIDLEGGWQPLTSLDGQILAFQNGEIYNYKELKSDLESCGFAFKTASDTEVLAHGYAHWGIDGLLDRVDGMFALAILDCRTNELHLARDRFGEKPLFYSAIPGKFAYSSSLLALAALPWADTSISTRALDWYLALHYVPGDITIFNGVGRVLPGQRLSVCLADPIPVQYRYYRPKLGRNQLRTNQDLASLIENAIVSRLVSDVPVGVFLSGGIDSSLVATIAAKHSPGIATFSMGFKDERFDENKFAVTVARNIKSNHHHFIFDHDSFETLLPIVVEALDEPLGDQAMLPVYWLSREARKYVTVVLSGEGADEIFGGYDYYRMFCRAHGIGNWFRNIIDKKTQVAPLTRRLAHNIRPITPSGFPLLADPQMRLFLMDCECFEENVWETDFINWLDGAADGLQRGPAADLGSWLPDDLLVKFDRMTMAHSLEGRAPYLQREIVQAGIDLSPSEKIYGTVSKVQLRKVAKRLLPDEILNRKKQGFVLPMKKWLQQWFNARGGAQSYFQDRNFPNLSMREVGRIVAQDISNGNSNERLCFSLVVLVEWYYSFEKRIRLTRKAMEV